MVTNVRKEGKPRTRKDIVHPELSYQLVGLLYDVFNELGPGHREKHYENAVEKVLKDAGLRYKRQLHVPLKYKEDKVGDYFLDFLINDQVVLELKQGKIFAKQNIKQVYAYLRSVGLQLGIIAQFTQDGLKFKRVVNLQ